MKQNFQHVILGLNHNLNKSPISHETKLSAHVIPTNKKEAGAHNNFVASGDVVTHIKGFFATYQQLHLSSKQTARVT